MSYINVRKDLIFPRHNAGYLGCCCSIPKGNVEVHGNDTSQKSLNSFVIRKRQQQEREEKEEIKFPFNFRTLNVSEMTSMPSPPHSDSEIDFLGYFFFH